MTSREGPENENESQDSDGYHLRCGFFMAKKNRKCSMQRKAGFKYCSEHLKNDEECLDKNERISCPLDPKHSIWKKDLAKHIGRCNAKRRKVVEKWFEKDLNITIKGTTSVENIASSPDSDLTTEKLYQTYIPILNRSSFEPLDLKARSHSGLDKKISELKKQKHAIQQSSLIGNLKEQGFLSSGNFYLEFGCGKAELSRFVNLCVLEDMEKSGETSFESNSYGFGLIDRGINRMKMDQKIVHDSQKHNCEWKPLIKRTRMDIKDLDLDKFLEGVNHSKIVCISKHLCGAATDLTITSLVNSSLFKDSNGRFGGLLIAMCCRHVCDYHQLLPQSRDFLKQRGFKTIESFETLKKMVSWAVNGAPVDPERKHVTGLSYSEREELGFKARRLLDESRLFALKSLLKEYDVQMFHYTEAEVTLENVCLCIKPRRSIY